MSHLPVQTKLETDSSDLHYYNFWVFYRWINVLSSYSFQIKALEWYLFIYLYSSALLNTYIITFSIYSCLNFLSFRATFCFTNPDDLSPQLLRISEGWLYTLLGNGGRNQERERKGEKKKHGRLSLGSYVMRRVLCWGLWPCPRELITVNVFIKAELCVLGLVQCPQEVETPPVRQATEHLGSGLPGKFISWRKLDVLLTYFFLVGWDLTPIRSLCRSPRFV
jgi:hypothetical protein